MQRRIRKSESSDEEKEPTTEVINVYSQLYIIASDLKGIDYEQL